MNIWDAICDVLVGAAMVKHSDKVLDLADKVMDAADKKELEKAIKEAKKEMEE